MMNCNIWTIFKVQPPGIIQICDYFFFFSLLGELLDLLTVDKNFVVSDCKYFKAMNNTDCMVFHNFEDNILQNPMIN